MKKVGGKENDRSPFKGDDKLQRLHNLGVQTGRAQAFGAIKILTEYLQMKTLAEIIDSKEYLDIPGVTSIEDYFQMTGIGKSTGYKMLKAGRTLSEDELQVCGVVGLTRQDLFTYAALPEDQRLQIKDGKVVNLENADKDDIKWFIEKLLQDNKKVKDAAVDLNKENERLKKEREHLLLQIPQGDGAYEMATLDEIEGQLRLLLNLLSHFAFSAGMITDGNVKARVQGVYTTGYRAFLEFIDKWEEHCGYGVKK